MKTKENWIVSAKRRLLEAHRQVADALRRRDAESAVAWTQKHLMDHRRGFEFAGLDMDAPIPEAS